jgi:hypothetical protein
VDTETCQGIRRPRRRRISQKKSLMNIHMIPVYTAHPVQPSDTPYERPDPIHTYNPHHVIPLAPIVALPPATPCYQYARSLRMFAGIDLFFSLLNGLFYFPAFVSCIFPLIGYYGARNYNFCCLYMYAGYIAAAAFFRGYLLLGTGDWYTLWAVLFYILNLYITYIVIRLTARLRETWRNLTDAERQELKEGLVAAPVAFVYY